MGIKTYSDSNHIQIAVLLFSPQIQKVILRLKKETIPYQKAHNQLSISLFVIFELLALS